MEKIGFLGGTFDPIHKGHLEIARIVADRLCLDKVFLIPAGQPPHKDGEYKKYGKHRLNMAYLAEKYDKRFKVSDYEILKEGKSYSYLTMEYFKNLFPDAQLFFIIGDEAYRMLHTWRHPEKLKKLVTFAVCSRDNKEVDSDAVKIEFPPINISSTMVRSAIKNGEDCSCYLTEEVYNYIKENNLYKG